MKDILLFTLLLTLSHFINGQVIDDNHIEFALTGEAPSHLQERLKSIDNVKFGTLETGVDSLMLTIGTYPKDDQLMCFAHLKNGKSSGFVMSYFKPIEDSNFLSFEMDFEIIPYTKKVSFRILKDLSTSKFYYTWLNGNEAQKSMAVLEINNPIKLNDPMPQFKVETLSEEELNSSDLLGNWVVINWWATSCAPCIKEMPGLNKLVIKHQTNENIKFIAIAQDDRSRWQNFLKRKQFDYEQTLSNDETKAIFGDSYPKNIILNPDGIVKYYSEGGHDDMYLEIDAALINLTTE